MSDYGTRKVGEVMQKTDDLARWTANLRKQRGRLTQGEREAVARWLSGMAQHVEATISDMLDGAS